MDTPCHADIPRHSLVCAPGLHGPQPRKRRSLDRRSDRGSAGGSQCRRRTRHPSTLAPMRPAAHTQLPSPPVLRTGPPLHCPLGPLSCAQVLEAPVLPVLPNITLREASVIPLLGAGALLLLNQAGSFPPPQRRPHVSSLAPLLRVPLPTQALEGRPNLFRHHGRPSARLGA